MRLFPHITQEFMITKNAGKTLDSQFYFLEKREKTLSEGFQFSSISWR